MPIDSTHPDYDSNVERWKLTRAIINNEAQAYIRKVDAKDNARSEVYVEHAVLVNFTALTKEGLVGLAYKKEPKIELPKELEYLLKDSTGDGRGLALASKETLGEVLEVGRHGLLEDYPTNIAEDFTAVSKLNTKDLKARIVPYSTESIINWEFTRTNNEDVLVYVILREPKLVHPHNDPFCWVETIEYRLLALDSEGYYYQLMYDEDLEPIEGTLNYQLDVNGNKRIRIPFQFVGAEDNNSSIDKAPLLDISEINKAHYRNSADYEESIFVVGQPSLFMGATIDYDEFKEANPNGIALGARAATWLGPDASAFLLQASPNQISSEGMKQKLEQAANLGARLISKPGGRETAEGVRVRFSSQNSSLHNVVVNVSDAYTRALKNVTENMGGNPDEIVFEINQVFYDETVDPQVIAQQMLMIDRKVMSKKEVRDNLKDTGLVPIDKTDEEFEAELKDEEEDLDPIINEVDNNAFEEQDT